MLFDATGKASLLSAISSALSLAQSLEPTPDNSTELTAAIAARDAAIVARDAAIAERNQVQILLNGQNARVAELEEDLQGTTAERNALRNTIDAARGEAEQLVVTLTLPS